MNFIQVVVGSFVFLMFLYVVGYLFLPIVLIGLVFFGVRAVYIRWLLYQAEKQANGCRIRTIKTGEHPHTKTNVIDVEYTEIR